MKEDLWTIRKMREAQKLSTTRNTYKKFEDEEIIQERAVSSKEKGDSLFGKMGTYFMLLLEEG